MGNNIKLKYEDLNGVIGNINTIDNKLESAYKTLGQSTDLGSSIMQAFWKFGNKDAIFGAVKKSQSDIKKQIDENKRIISLLRQVEGIYENAGKKSFINSFITDEKLRYAGLIAAFDISPIVGLFVMNWQNGNITSIYHTFEHLIEYSNQNLIASFSGGFGLPAIINLFHENNQQDQPLESRTTAENTSKMFERAAEEARKLRIQEGKCLSDIWQGYADKSPNGFTNYNKKGNCTWYADHRWSQMNPDYPLSFPNGISDAKGWVNTIDKSKFNVLSTADTGNIKANSIAVSQNGGFGHVAYIEDVRDGKVYYTEDGEKITRPATWLKDEKGNWVGPTVQCCTLEEFKGKFGNVITKK